MKAPLFLLLAIAAASFAAPLVGAAAGIDPNMVDLLDRLAGAVLMHPLGTDELGRDVLVRLLAAAAYRSSSASRRHSPRRRSAR